HVPTLRVQTDTLYTNFATLVPITAGARVTLSYSVVDPDHRPETWQFRRQLIAARVAGEDLAKSGNWEPAVHEREWNWTPQKPGTYTFAAQYVDVDLNYSPATVAVLTVVPVCYLNPRIARPAAPPLAPLI